MNYIGNDKLNRVCLGVYNKTYLGNDILYWNTSTEAEEVGSYIRVELNDQWQLSTETYNTAYVGYESFSNYNIHNSLARMRVYFKGYDNFDFKIMSNGENNYDYVMVGYLDYDWSDGTYNTMQYNKSNIYSHTRGKNNTWVDVTFSINDDNEHFFDVAYRKDSSGNVDADKGYINLMLEILGEKWVASDTEWIEEDGKYYIKENKYVTVNNIDWIKTSELRKGMELTIGYELVDGYLCNNGNKYQKMELYFTNHPTMTEGIGVYVIGDMLEENSADCEFVSNFLFNFNFNDYNEATTSVPNKNDALWHKDLELQGTVNVINDGSNNYIKVESANAYAQYEFASADENPFYILSGDTSLTLIYKVSGGTGPDLISNRWSNGYSWMVRQYSSRSTLHLNNGVKGSISISNQPTVIAIVLDGLTLTYYNLTDNTTTTTALTSSDIGKIVPLGFNFFGSKYSSSATLDEKWTGNCYWMFCARRVLSIDEINVVATNNGM